MDRETPILAFDRVNVRYGSIQVLFDVSLEVFAGELVCLLGGNASGKSTTLKTILGVVAPYSGEVRLKGCRINGSRTPAIIGQGVAIVPENRRIFPRLTVLENLELGAYLRKDTQSIRADIDRMLSLFPRLGERLHQPGMTLSGGEQQMLAMARALMSRPEVLLMDEPSMGLSPLLVDQQFDIIRQVHQDGTTIFLVEQNASMALSIADRGYVLQTGAVVLEGEASDLLKNPEMRTAYLGGGD